MDGFDLTKLSPAPWTAHGCNVDSPCDEPGAEPVGGNEGFRIAKTWSSSFAPRAEIAATNAVFIALARNAEDVMVRMGWHPELCSWGDTLAERLSRPRWCVRDSWGNRVAPLEAYHPFIAVMETYEWHKAKYPVSDQPLLKTAEIPAPPETGAGDQ